MSYWTKFVLILILIHSNYVALCQSGQEKMPITDVIKQISKNESVKFYFHEEWLDTIKTSSVTTVEELLQFLKSSADLNYHRIGQQIFLLRQKSPIHNFISSDQGSREKMLFARELGLQDDDVLLEIGDPSAINRNSTVLISGQVKHIDTGEPIPGAAIFESTSNFSAVTDQKGNYSMEIPLGKHDITAQFSGFEDKRLVIYVHSGDTLNIQLTPGIITLQEIAVVADMDANVNSAQTGKNSLQIKQLDNIPKVLGETDIMQVALSLPGVQNVGEGSTGINVRGGKADQNLILLDRAVIYNPFHFFGFFSSFNSDIIKSVDIYKGNVPVNYGGRLSSLLAVSTDPGDKINTHVDVGISPVTSKLSFNTPVVKERSSLTFGGRTTYSKYVISRIDNENVRQSDPSFHDLTTSYFHQFENNSSIKFSGYYSKDQFRLTPDSLYQYRNFGSSLQWNQVINKNLNVESASAWSRYDYQILFQSDSLGAFQYGFDIEDLYFSESLHWNLDNTHQLSIGGDLRIYDLTPGYLQPFGENSLVETRSIDRERGREAAVYFSDEFKLFSKWLFDVGLRYSFFQPTGGRSIKFYHPNTIKSNNSIAKEQYFGRDEVISTFHGPEARVSVVYSLPLESSVKLSFNSMRQYIHVLSNNVTISPTDTWKLSDPNFEPQLSHQISMGYFRNFSSNTIEASVEGYYKVFSNIVDYKVGADLILNPDIEQDILQGNGLAFGVEFLIKKNAGALTGWLGYAFSRSLQQFNSSFAEERINNGNYFPSNFDKPHNLTAVSNYKITRRYSVSANLVYTSGRPVTYPTAIYTLNGSEVVHFANRNQFRVPDYFRMDLSFNVEGSHKNTKRFKGYWSFSIYNVTARKNVYSIFFENRNGEIKAYKLAVLGAAIPSISYNIEM